MKRRNWTRGELILAFNLYCKIPFGQCNHKNEDVVNLGKIIERTPSAVAFKLGNFASLDPYHQQRGVKGLKNTGKLDKEIYLEFSNNWSDLIFESESLLVKMSGKGDIVEINEIQVNHEKTGAEVIRSVKTRVNQAFFRKVVLSIYSKKCAITNIDLPELLIASHIIPWSKNEKERLNPSNGICLSPLYDKIFDKGLMSVSEDYRIKLSSKLSIIADDHTYSKFFKSYEDKKINLPEKFIPKQEFLEYHRNHIFQP